MHKRRDVRMYQSQSLSELAVVALLLSSVEGKQNSLSDSLSVGLCYVPPTQNHNPYVLLLAHEHEMMVVVDVGMRC